MKDHHSRVWELIGEARACMFVTRYSGGLRARPLQPRPDREAGLVRFVTDMRGTKDDEIEADPDVCLIFIDRDHKAYLSLTGRARIMRDTEAAARIWRKDDDVWWPGGPDDPNVRVIEFEPEAAELWDGPASEAVAAFEFAKARTTGEMPNLGENRKVTVDM